jgi:DNA-binding GntR family transcriptional regulator
VVEEPLERVTTRELVFRRLKDMIHDSEILPGQRIPLQELGKQWQVSQQPIKMACYRLEMLGLVSVRPQKGTFVRQPTRQEFEWEYNARFGLETWAIRRCMEICPDELIERICDAGIQAEATPDDTGALGQIDIQLHEWVMLHTENPVMENLWRQIEAVTHLAGADAVARGLRVHWSPQEYKDMCDAVTQKDMATLASLWRQHMDYMIDNLAPDPENA